MQNDPIIEEIHQIREAHAAKFNYDINAIVKDFQEKQKRRGLSVVSFLNQRKPKSPQTESS
jgi:hypothetical protein